MPVTAGSEPGWLAAIEPARPTVDPAAARPDGDDPDGKVDGIVDADGALDRSAPGASSAGYRTSDEVTGKNSDAAGVKHKRSVVKEFGLAMAQRWAKGGGTTNKRLDLKKAQAMARQVKETRTTTTMKSGGLPVRNSPTGGGGGGKNTAGKPQGNGRAAPAGNNSGGTGRGGTGGSPGGSGGHGSPGSGSGNQQTGKGKDTAPGKNGGKGAPGSSGSNGAGGASGPAKSGGNDASGNGKNNGAGSAGKNSGSPGSGQGPKNHGAGSSGKGGQAGSPGKDGASGKQGASGKDGKAGTSGSPGGGSGNATTPDTKTGRRPKRDQAGHGHAGVDTRTPLEKSRDIGHGDGGAIRNGVDHVKAYAKGVKDGWDDTKTANARDHTRLDGARDDRRKQQADKDGQPKPAPTTATTGDGRTVAITTDEGDDGVSTDVKPLLVKAIDANALTLGTDGARGSVSRKELRNFKQYERKLEAKETHLAKIAEACQQLKKSAESEAEDCQKLKEQAKSVAGGEKVAQKLAKLADAAKSQATEAAELHKRAARATEMCKVVRTNINTRYAPLYKAVVDSDETKPAELRFYSDKGSYAPAA
ncbi:hypothetical protein [Streptomyces cacaoi]|uniref:hypothetical protein n=1 Tax=Streptomyces cacaoi TaxID=1898 RepID=UPI001FD0FD04|nr:hypothetical protein [Streptomyces cacaoi]